MKTTVTIAEVDMQKSTDAPVYECLWCPYTDAVRKRVMSHMESCHHALWCALALMPPIAGGAPI
jgi:hypothetical protein